MIIPTPAPVLTGWFAPFASAFTAPTLRGALVLIAGTILTPGRRTVSAALSIMGLREVATFTTFHRVLNRNRWSSRDLARRLLHLLVETFVPAGPVVMAIDETIERRWGARIRTRGIYPIQSAPAMATSSRPQACAGLASCSWRRSPGPVACGPCRS
jgi:hypothetical protein